LNRDRYLAVFGAALLLFIILLAFECGGQVKAAKSSATRAAPAPIRRAICRVFARRCLTALRVAYCETGGTFNRFALGDDGERGLFQIHPVHFGWLDERRLYEALYNARAAYRLSRGGRDWSHWTCQP
jgi:Lysozyme like domain